MTRKQSNDELAAEIMRMINEGKKNIAEALSMDNLDLSNIARSAAEIEAMREKLRARKKAAWDAIDAKRNRYDPETEGYGTRRDWRADFSARMGFDEAVSTLKKRSPRLILGMDGIPLSPTCDWDTVKAAYRRRCMDTHPDRTEITKLSKAEAERQFKEVNAAYTVLAREYGEG